MSSNRGLAYIETGVVEIQSIDFPELSIGERACQHGVILKIVTTISVAAISTWCEVAPRRRQGSSLDTRSLVR